MSYAAPRGWRLGVALATLLLVSGLPGVASAQAVYETVHSFIQSPGRPIGRLLKAGDGRIFGVTSVGGQHRGGAIFVAAQDAAGAWTVSTFHQFRSIDGITPLAGLAFGLDGAMYGTTAQGGAHGGGTVYRITLGGAFQVLHHLRPAADGFAPLYEPLALGLDGAFYGTAYAGGLHGRGTIFRVTPLGACTVLRIFAGIDGAFPTGGLVRGSDGAFYGTTTLGGPSDMGTVFRVTAQGNFTRLLAFSPALAFAQPRGGLVQASDGNFYGVAGGSGTCVTLECSLLGSNVFGNGGVFAITPTGVFGYAAGFPTRPLGQTEGKPQPGLASAADGRIYGVTQNDHGSFDVFTVTVGTFGWQKVFYGRFDPDASLSGDVVLSGVTTLDNGAILVATSSGARGGQGALVQVAPEPEPDSQVLTSFASAGYSPTGRLTAAADGRLYGTAHQGGNALCTEVSCGTVFSVGPGELAVDIWSHFRAPIGDMTTTSTGTLYFADLPNGTNNDAANEITTAGVFVRRFGRPAFHAPTETPGNVIYGVEADDVHSLWRADPDSDAVRLHQFSGPDGLFPYGALLYGADGNLYGTTAAGGAAGFGTVFRFVPGGSLTTLHHFSGPDGAHPLGTLAQGSDGLLYGTTHRGGVGAGGGNGVVFRISPDGTGFTVLHALTSGEGINPVAGLTQGTGNVLYGTAIAGGSGGGSVFAISSTGIFETLHVFAAGEGVAPMGGVTVMPDGSLYGTTVAGGAGGVGLIYRLTPAPTATKK
jgi:uncharacterized repeat protein (TIGR03803 family)